MFLALIGRFRRLNIQINTVSHEIAALKIRLVVVLSCFVCLCCWLDKMFCRAMDGVVLWASNSIFSSLISSPHFLPTWSIEVFPIDPFSLSIRCKLAYAPWSSTSARCCCGFRRELRCFKFYRSKKCLVFFYRGTFWKIRYVFLARGRHSHSEPRTHSSVAFQFKT